jgi:hypothetical protein
MDNKGVQSQHANSKVRTNMQNVSYSVIMSNTYGEKTREQAAIGKTIGKWDLKDIGGKFKRHDNSFVRKN